VRPQAVDQVTAVGRVKLPHASSIGRRRGPHRVWACAVLEGAEDQLDGAVDFSGLRCVEAACEISKAGGVDDSHLVD
jgi:hypothetical protein